MATLATRVSLAANTGGANSPSVLTAFAAVAGNFIVVCMSSQSNGADNVTSVTDTAGNTYVQAGSPFRKPATANTLQIFYAWNITGHASNVVTVTWVAAPAIWGVAAEQWSGVKAAADPVTDNQTGSGSGASAATASVAIDASGDLIIAQMVAIGQSISGTNGYTANAQSFSGLSYFADLYHVASANEAATASCGFGDWAIKAASFKQAAASSAIKTVDGLARASVKTVQGLAIASVKTIQGLT